MFLWGLPLSVEQKWLALLVFWLLAGTTSLRGKRSHQAANRPARLPYRVLLMCRHSQLLHCRYRGLLLLQVRIPCNCRLFYWNTVAGVICGNKIKKTNEIFLISFLLDRLVLQGSSDLNELHPGRRISRHSWQQYNVVQNLQSTAAVHFIVSMETNKQKT